MNKKWFTLMELMVVIVILGIMAAVAIPKFIEASKRARGEQVESGSGTTTIPLFETRIVRDSIPKTITPDETNTSRCIEGYKFIVSPNGNLNQLLDSEGHGIRCFEKIN